MGHDPEWGAGNMHFWEQRQRELDEERLYEQWLAKIRANPLSGDGGGLLLVLFSVAAAALTMVGLGTFMASAGVTGFRGSPGFIFAIPGVLVGLGVFLGAGRLFFNLREDAPPAPRRAARITVTAAAFVLLGAGAALGTRWLPPRGAVAAAGSPPAGYAETAAADFAEAMRLLAEGKVTDSADRYAAAMQYRTAGAASPEAQRFGEWCGAREAEYGQAVAAALPSLVARVEGGELVPAEVDNLLRHAPPEAREAWQAERPAVERRLAAAVAARSYRAEMTISNLAADDLGDEDPDAPEHGDVSRLEEDEEQAILAAVSERIGGAPLVRASELKDVEPEAGLGTVRVTLQFVHERFTTDSRRRAQTFKVPVALNATVQVNTRAAPGNWDGTHHYLATAPVPPRLTEAQVIATHGKHQRALVQEVAARIGRDTPDDPAAADERLQVAPGAGGGPR